MVDHFNMHEEAMNYVGTKEKKSVGSLSIQDSNSNITMLLRPKLSFQAGI